MNRIITRGIVLSRTDYGEADRIVTLLTPDHGKLRLLARGVRKVKSKLAGGIELFSISSITFIRGRGELGTLVSARLDKHYGEIVGHIDRVQLGYELIKLLHKATEDEPESEYFELLQQLFEALNNPRIETEVIRFWFLAQLLRLSGRTPNLLTDTSSNKLQTDQKYTFDYEAMAFVAQKNGRFGADHIKLLRLAFSTQQPQLLQQVIGLNEVLPGAASIPETISRL